MNVDVSTFWWDFFGMLQEIVGKRRTLPVRQIRDFCGDTINTVRIQWLSTNMRYLWWADTKVLLDALVVSVRLR